MSVAVRVLGVVSRALVLVWVRTRYGEILAPVTSLDERLSHRFKRSRKRVLCSVPSKAIPTPS